MTKRELLTGMVVELNNDTSYRVQKANGYITPGILTHRYSFIPLSAYDEDLQLIDKDTSDDFRIIEVRVLPVQHRDAYLLKPILEHELINKSTEVLWRAE